MGTRERAAPLFRRLKELESYMDPSFGESKGEKSLFSAILVELSLQMILPCFKMLQI